ncbi:hypothetical protein [uncultured Shewanella sp.]|uniref:hypothetical protein n=1 Tax=uncultured Shewanella sp. TaxID=173975 RepID=UPI00262EF0DC|nr:hypothetical protein [uncultured Shewanella sp.]
MGAPTTDKDSNGEGSSSSSINTVLKPILSNVNSNMTLIPEDFFQLSNAILSHLTVINVSTLNAESIEKLRLLHHSVLLMIESEEKPVYNQCIAYEQLQKIFLLGVLRRYEVRPFQLYFNTVTFVHYIEHILELNFTKTPYMIENAKLMLDELPELINKEVLIRLSKNEVSDLKNAMSKLYDFFSLSKKSNNDKLRLIHILKNLITPIIGYDKFVIDQDIIVEINPLDDNVEPVDVSLVSNEEQNDTDESQLSGLMLFNYHILELNLSLSTYGFSGSVEFQLSYDDIPFHSDYSFLYQNTPVSIALTINNTYFFDDPDDEDEKYQKKLSLQGVGDLKEINNLQLNGAIVAVDIEEDTAEFSSKRPVFTLKFHDALQSIWRSHCPVYIDFAKSYLDIFSDNLFCSYWVEFDTDNTTLLATEQKQIVVGTQGRSFYDYFIEVLQSYGTYLYYDYSSLDTDNYTGQVTYILSDDLGILQDDSSDEEVALTHKDLERVISVNFYTKQPWYGSESVFNASVDNPQQSEITDIYSEDWTQIEWIRKDSTKIIDDSTVYTNFISNYSLKRQAEEDDAYTYQLELSEIMPFMTLEPSYVPYDLDTDQWACSITNFSPSVTVFEQHLCYRQNEEAKIALQQELLTVNYAEDADSEEDWFEKIAEVEVPDGITHFLSMTSIWKDSNTSLCALPAYVPFQPFVSEGVITIGDDVDDSMQNAYSFFTGQDQTAEGAFSADQSSGSENYTWSEQSENIVTYAVTLPNILYADPDNTTPVFIPALVLNATSNGFHPLRNGDYVRVAFENPERCKIESIFISNPIGTDKASEKRIQATTYGPKEECQLAYTQDSDDQVFQICQTGSDEQVGNSFSLSQSNGVVISFSDESSDESSDEEE